MDLVLSKKIDLPDHFIRPLQHAAWNCQTNLFCRFQVDDEFKLRRLLHRQISRFGTFQTAKQKQVSAIMTMSTGPFFAERKRIAELAVKYRLPAIYPENEFVDGGGLMSYGADYDDLYRRAAIYVDKILKDAKPADLPVQQATKFEFVINLKAAKQIGLTIPGRVLERANQVIK